MKFSCSRILAAAALLIAALTVFASCASAGSSLSGGPPDNRPSFPGNPPGGNFPPDAPPDDAGFEIPTGDGNIPTPESTTLPDETTGDLPTTDAAPTDDTTPDDETPDDETPVPDVSGNSAVFASRRDGKELSLRVTSQGGEFTGSVKNGVLSLSVEEETTFTLEGAYDGGIVVNANENVNVEIALNGCAISASGSAPALCIARAKNASVSAKAGTENEIVDERQAVEELSSALYCACDLKLKGSGSLRVVSENNNGVHGKDDLEVRNLTLTVNAVDNALKGNDSVTILSGTLTLIARQGDGIKTSKSGLSSSGVQRGNVTIEGGKTEIFAACDGIDAACDVIIRGTPTVNIKTDKYSSYSETVTKTAGKTLWVRAASADFRYSICFSNGADRVWVNSSSYTAEEGGGFGGRQRRYYFYEFARPEGYASLTLYVYTAGQEQGQNADFYAATSTVTINESFDTISFSTERGRNSFSWTNRTQTGRDGRGGPGGEGNRDKGAYSTKGVKAANAITISGGTLTVEAYDDALHAGTGETPESGKTPLGNITVSGGTLTLSSNDDGIHADGTADIQDGEITVNKSYEALEANIVRVSGGKTVLTASDDGVNACGGSAKPAVEISGGILDITVPPNGDTDGIDSNGTYQQTGGLVITRGPNNPMSAALDSEGTAMISGGTLIVLGQGNVKTGGSVKTVGLSLHSAGNHTVTVDGVSYAFANAYSYGKTVCCSDRKVTA